MCCTTELCGPESFSRLVFWRAVHSAGVLHNAVHWYAPAITPATQCTLSQPRHAATCPPPPAGNGSAAIARQARAETGQLCVIGPICWTPDLWLLESGRSRPCCAADQAACSIHGVAASEGAPLLSQIHPTCARCQAAQASLSCGRTTRTRTPTTVHLGPCCTASGRFDADGRGLLWHLGLDMPAGQGCPGPVAGAEVSSPQPT